MWYFLIIILILIIIISLIYLCFNYKKLCDTISDFFTELDNLKINYITYIDASSLYYKYKPIYFVVRMYFSHLFKEFVYFYDHFFDEIDRLNDEFIENELIRTKDYFDTLLSYKLDIQQRKAVLTDDNNNLIIAAAGSGKTSSIISKVKYLIDIKKVNPDEIVVISFTNATVDEFKKRLDDERVKCYTFHKLGKSILEFNSVKVDVDENLLRKVIRDYFEEGIYKDKEMLKTFIKFSACYLYVPTDLDNYKFSDICNIEHEYDLETLEKKYFNYYKKDLEKYKTRNKNKFEILNRRYETLKSEQVKSYEELAIANYLFLNGIKYTYEKPYKFSTATKDKRQYKPDFYLDDYGIYLEHFGINRDGRAPYYDSFLEQQYLDKMNWARELHRENKTTLIETYSYQFFDGTIFDELENKLKNNGVKFKAVNAVDIGRVLLSNPNNEITDFKALIEKFIHLFKGNNFDVFKFDEFIKDARQKNNNRNIMLLLMFKKTYELYQEALKESNQIDFDDMINLATKKVKENGFDKKISYLIVDEFQDVSFSRYELLKSLQDCFQAKIVAVGDDWQSIYRFSGCDLDLFVNFKKYFLRPRILFVESVYRNSQNLVDISSSFIMKNINGQIKKNVYSKVSNVDKPVEILYFSNDIMDVTLLALDKLKSYGCKNVAILGRNNSDLNKYVEDKDLRDRKAFDLSELFDGFPVVFTTIHKAKGLEYDGVILCNMFDHIAGFPNKMSDDPVLNYVTLSNDNYLYEEERRLFYVALTRTKTKCILLVPDIKPSIFAKEILNDKNLVVDDSMIKDNSVLFNPGCPICKSGRLLLRVNNKDKSRFVSCTNYPRCFFSTKYVTVLEDEIMTCPSCNSYLVKKNGKYGEFYGCLNYPECNQSVDIEDHYDFKRE